MNKVLNTRGKKFLTKKGVRTPKTIWETKCSKGNTYTEMTRKGLISHIQRIEILMVSNPELF